MTQKITDWSDADEVLYALASVHRELTALAATRDETIHQAKESCARAAEPLEERVEALEAELHRFTLAHQDDLDGRSKALNHGRLGFLLVHRLRIRSMKRAIDWLLEAKKLAYLHVKHSVNKETLAKAPPEILKACGAKIRSEDEFWYEVDGERHAVEG